MNVNHYSINNSNVDTNINMDHYSINNSIMLILT